MSTKLRRTSRAWVLRGKRLPVQESSFSRVLRRKETKDARSGYRHADLPRRTADGADESEVECQLDPIIEHVQ
jgi:hypothetical protein